MARKFDLISELYERTCFAVTDNPVNWQSFLKTAGRNFRLRFDEQLLIYAQRPDATAVLEIERWNGTFGRWVNRGAKGIAVFEDADRSRQRLIHYFDISDTHESRYSRPVPIWEMRPDYEAEVIETLENTFGAVNDTTSIENVVKESIANAVEDNIADYISDFMGLGAGSDIEYLSADEANALYLELVRNSVSYMVMARLGLDADKVYSPDDFVGISSFNSQEVLNAVGIATSDIAEMALLPVSRTISTLSKENRIIDEQGQSEYNKDIKDERSQSDERNHIHDGGRLQSSEPEAAGADGSNSRQMVADDDYLYEFGEYISKNELGTAHHLRNLPQETLQKMADVYTEGYRVGFINTGKDLSKKSIVNIRYSLGFEKVICLAIENFRKMGLKPVIYRAASSVITKREHHKIGYYGAIANQQYEYDHRQDQALFMDKRYVERKLEVMKTVFEQNKEMAAGVAGPAVMEIFGETPFSPEAKETAPSYDEAQRELDLLFSSKSGQITNEYIKGEERSFTIVAYPVPEIGADYAKIFDEVIKINTLDAKLYEKVQQTMIDALDQGTCVHVKGKGENQTDITVQLYPLKDAQKETIFENCVADVNIPVGEVFTSPVLEGTNGILHVSKVYLDGLQYQNLKLTFKDGRITDYTCTNFEDEKQNKKYIYDNVLKNHETLPLGEFAIGTNTTAYVAAKKFNIEDKMPILIAEKTGPHFAVGDTCYSWSEEIRVYNPNGKEIVAKDNSCSLLRKEDVSKAYFNCHTDITVPYKELEEISVVTNERKDIILLENGRFVLPGTEVLNEPLDEAGF